MSKVVREDIDTQNAVITVTLSKADYEAKVMEELKNYRKKAHVKGFRKGKTPIGFVKKLYGKAVLAEVVNEKLQNELFEFLKNEKIDFLGQPLPSEQQEEQDFDINNLSDFVFKFDLGLAPVFEIQGLGMDAAYDRYAVVVPDSVVTEEMEKGQRALGTQEPVEENIEESDVLSIDAEELEGDTLKPEGWASSFSVSPADFADENLKNEVLSLKAGDKFRFNIFELEKGRDEDFVKKYILGMAEGEEVEVNPEFEGLIKEVKRLKPAELNQDFLDKYFGEGKVQSEEEAREIIKQDIQGFYDKQADNLFFNTLREKLIENNQLDLPDAFLKRWLTTTDEKNTADQVEKEYPNLTEIFRWNLIKNKVVKDAGIEASKEEILDNLKETVRGYYARSGMFDETFVDRMAERLLEDEGTFNKSYEDVILSKVFYKMKDMVGINDVEIQMEDFKKVIEDANQKQQALNTASQEEEE